MRQGVSPNLQPDHSTNLAGWEVSEILPVSVLSLEMLAVVLSFFVWDLSDQSQVFVPTHTANALATKPPPGSLSGAGA